MRSSRRSRSPNVAGDRDELFRVFENLVENAIKYGARASTSTSRCRPRAPEATREVASRCATTAQALRASICRA